MTTKKATLNEIAKVFGVSPVTVSNALNKRKNVSPDKARAISQYAEKIGYQPSLLAQSLLRGQTHIVGLLLKETPEDPWNGAILNRLQEKLWNKGYYLSMFVATDGKDRLVDGVKFLAQLKVDALIIGPMGFAEEYNLVAPHLNSFPFVTVFDTVEHMPVDNAKIDAYSAAQLAVDHLVENGHRDIGMLGVVSHEKHLPDLKTRYSGFIDTLKRHNLEIRDEWIMEESIHSELASDKLVGLIRSGNMPSAFFCHNDQVAAETIKLLYDHNIKVPDDISVIGVNNLPIAEMMIPGITSVSFNLDHYVDKIIELTMDNLSGKTKTARTVRYQEDPKLIKRGSVKRI